MALVGLSQVGFGGFDRTWVCSEVGNVVLERGVSWSDNEVFLFLFLLLLDVSDVGERGTSVLELEVAAHFL